MIGSLFLLIPVLLQGSPAPKQVVRNEWRVSRRDTHQALLSVSASGPESDLRFLMEVPSGLLVGGARRRDGRDQQFLCDPGTDDCVVATEREGSERAPRLFRLATAQRGFWFFPADAASDTAELNARLIFRDLRPTFVESLRETAAAGVVDPRLVRLKALLSLVLRQGKAESPRDLTFEGWQPTAEWSSRFARLRNREPPKDESERAFETVPLGTLGSYVRARLQRAP